MLITQRIFTHLTNRVANFIFYYLEKHEDLPRNIMITIIGLLIATYFFCYYWKRIRNLPPGPWGFPIVGYLYSMGHEKHTSFMELAKKYGAIFSTNLGDQTTVVISDYKLIRKALGRKILTGRPETPFFQTLNGYGVVNSTGELWRTQRSFIISILKNFGMTKIGKGPVTLEKRIMIEVNDLLEHIKASNGQPIDLRRYYAVTVSNVICNIMMSVRFRLNDPKFDRLINLIEEGMRLFGEIHTVDYIPIIQYLPGKRHAKTQLLQNREEMFDFYREIIDEHRKTYDETIVRDLVDAYLKQMKDANANGYEKELFYGKDHEQQLMQVMADLFSAGMDTIKTTLLWINVYMLHNPDKMKLVQNELDQIVGRSRLPSLQDKEFLPITVSTIYESMRCSSIVPLATTHSPLRYVQIGNYTIPPGAHVIPLISSVHMDPKLWENPEIFNPSRFIDAQGKLFKPEYFMPFGVGHRSCLGEILAKTELFLIFSTMMHTFDMSLPDGESLPSLKGNAGATITPQQYDVCLTPRPFYDAPKDTTE